MSPVLTDFFRIALLLVGMFGAGETVEFIQFDVLGRNAHDDFLVGGFSLRTGPADPSLDGGRMNAFNASYGFRAQAFESLPDGALDFLFRRFEIIKGRPEAVAESLSTLPATKDEDGLAAP
jgi:hypothetical protein